MFKMNADSYEDEAITFSFGDSHYELSSDAV
jgi:hypothetical protein